MVVFGQKWFYSGKNVCILEKVVVFRHSDCIPEKVVVFLQNGFILAKVVVLGQK